MAKYLGDRHSSPSLSVHNNNIGDDDEAREYVWASQQSGCLMTSFGNYVRNILLTTTGGAAPNILWIPVAEGSNKIIIGGRSITIYLLQS